MKRFFDANKDAGTVNYFDYDDQTDEITIQTVQDVSGLLDQLRNKRNDIGDRAIKEEFWHYATIPAVVEIELRNKGIDIYDKNCTKRLYKEINENYPWLKASNKHHR